MVDTEFLDALASKEPIPGGGGASAYGGALAASLASMVGNLTVGKKAYAGVQDEVEASLARLAELRVRLLALVDGDARAFEPLAAAYRMPKGTPEECEAKCAATQCALSGACDVPLDIMRASVEVMRECDLLARKGTRLAISDAGAAVAFARAALYGASLNVYINIGNMDDKERALSYRDEADALIDAGSTLADEVYTYVSAQIDALY